MHLSDQSIAEYLFKFTHFKSLTVVFIRVLDQERSGISVVVLKSKLAKINVNNKIEVTRVTCHALLIEWK